MEPPGGLYTDKIMTDYRENGDEEVDNSDEKETSKEGYLKKMTREALKQVAFKIRYFFEVKKGRK